MKYSCLVLLALLFSLVLVGSVQFESTKGSTSVGGVISSNATWSQASGPWNLTGNVLIDSGAVVTIESGTTVNLNGYYIRVNGSLVIQSAVVLNMGIAGTNVGNIQVNGVLSARGDSSSPIYFNGATYQWDSLFVPATTSSVTFTSSSAAWEEQSGSGCIIEYAVMNRTGVTASSSIKFSNNQVNGSGVSCISGSPIIKDNKIQASISVGGGSPTIANNNIEGYIWMDGSSNIASPVITSNYISNLNPQYPYATAAGIAVLATPYAGSGEVLIEKNVITGSSVGIDLIYRETQDITKPLTIRYNTILSNDVCIQIAGKFSPTITNNNFYSNHTCIKLTPASHDMSAVQNYWGTTDSSAVDGLIYDYYDDFNLGKVTYSPILNSPDPTAPDPDKFIPQIGLSGVTTNPTTNPTATSTSPTQNPPSQDQITDGSNQQSAHTSNPSTQPQTFLGTDWITIAIIALLALIVVLLAANILYTHKKALGATNSGVSAVFRQMLEYSETE